MKSKRQKQMEALERWEARVKDCVRGKSEGVSMKEPDRIEYWVSRSEVAVKQIEILRNKLGIRKEA